MFVHRYLRFCRERVTARIQNVDPRQQSQPLQDRLSPASDAQVLRNHSLARTKIQRPQVGVKEEEVMTEIDARLSRCRNWGMALEVTLPVLGRAIPQ